MNIKGFGIANLLPTESRDKVEAKDRVKAEASGDRDADGRRQQGEGSQESLTEEHIQKALEYLKSHSGVVDNGLNVRRMNSGDRVIIVIEDQYGKIVRRILEAQIVVLAKTSKLDEEKGQLYNRAM